MNKAKFQKQEISVQEAAHYLNVTTRSILNYIGQKEIEALKVGKTWFIKSASLDAFMSRYQFKDNKEEALNDTVSLARAVSVNAPINSSTNTPRESASVDLSDNEKKKKKVQSLLNLKLFELIRLSLLNTKLEKEKKDHPYLVDHFNNLLLEAIEYLGAGFYAYEFQHKKSYYNLSREKIGAILSLLHSFDPKNSRIKNLEEDLLPAYSALIKKLEKINGLQHEKNKHEASKNLR